MGLVYFSHGDTELKQVTIETFKSTNIQISNFTFIINLGEGNISGFVKSSAYL